MRGLIGYSVAVFALIADVAGALHLQMVQGIPTHGCMEVTPFVIGGRQMLAFANTSDGSTTTLMSPVYAWDPGSKQFQLLQEIPTTHCRDIEHFCIDDQDYIAVAEGMRGGLSHVYRWNGSAFELTPAQQVILADSDMYIYDFEFFQMDGAYYLAAAGSTATDSNGRSKVYQWDAVTRQFVHLPSQTFSHFGAVDGEFIQTGSGAFLAWALEGNYPSYNLNSEIRRWNNGSCDLAQSVPTYGASDWDSHTFAGTTFLAVANRRQNTGDFGGPSKVYRYDGSDSFVEIQAITTSGAKGVHFFEFAETLYLAIANSEANGGVFNLPSRIYRWDGAAFQPDCSLLTSHAMDIETFTIGDTVYLAVANFYDGSTGNIDSRIYELSNEPPQTGGLIAHYPLNGTAEDASGNGNDGTAHGPYVADDAEGEPDGKSMFSDGSISKYFDSNIPMWNPEHPFTACMWVKLTALERLWGSSEGAGDLAYGTYVGSSSPTSLRWWLGGMTSAGTCVDFTSSFPITDNTWHHLAFVHEAGIRACNMVAYLDGQPMPAVVFQDNATAYNAPGENRSIVFLALRHSRGVLLPGGTGLMDEIRLYDRALTAEEVRRIFNPNSPPVAECPPNLAIATSQQNATIVVGRVTDVDGGVLEYKWLIDGIAAQEWTPVAPDSSAPLNLANMPPLRVGPRELRLLARDSFQAEGTDDMILTVENSVPEAQPAPPLQTLEVCFDPLQVVADVADYDGDELTYCWVLDRTPVVSGTIRPPFGGQPVAIPPLVIPASDRRLTVGLHEVQLVITDGVNEPVVGSVLADIVDTKAPVLSPVPSTTILWPPRHELEPVTVQANASDCSGRPVRLEVQVESTEPPDAKADGTTIPDFCIDSVDNATGIIHLRLRSERAGTGTGRLYTVYIGATDASGNQSVAAVEIAAPHDRGKKK